MGRAVSLIFIDKTPPILTILYSFLIAFAYYVLQYLFFIQLPYMMQRGNSLDGEMEQAKKNIKKLNNLKDEKEKNLKNTKNEVKIYRIKRDIEKIEKFIKMESNHLDRVILCEKHTHFSESYKENNNCKIQDIENHFFFIRKRILNSKTNQYICLIPLKNSLNKLIKVVNEKPASVQLLENKIFIYLNELQNLIIKYEQLTDKNKVNYAEKINYITSYITAYVDEFEERIDKSNMRDIDIGINVLLSELNQYKQKAEEIRTIQTELAAKKKSTSVIIKKQKSKRIYDRCTQKYISHKIKKY